MLVDHGSRPWQPAVVGKAEEWLVVVEGAAVRKWRGPAGWFTTQNNITKRLHHILHLVQRYLSIEPKYPFPEASLWRTLSVALHL